MDTKQGYRRFSISSSKGNQKIKPSLKSHFDKKFYYMGSSQIVILFPIQLLIPILSVVSYTVSTIIFDFRMGLTLRRWTS